MCIRDRGKVDSANSAISALDLELSSLGIDKKRAEEEVKKAEEAFNSAATDSVSGNDIQQLEEALKAAKAALAKIDDDISKKNLEKNSKNSELNNAKDVYKRQAPRRARCWSQPMLSPWYSRKSMWLPKDSVPLMKMCPAATATEVTLPALIRDF